jgi:dTDP-4-dehydrorhamnose 3,5-epimerase
VRGAIYDVIVDFNPGSPTFLKWIGVELSPTGRRMLFVPAGFAHGFQTLIEESEVNYLVSHPYVATAARGLRFDDPALGIVWPEPVSCTSRADRSWPRLDVESVAAGRMGRPGRLSSRLMR